MTDAQRKAVCEAILSGGYSVDTEDEVRTSLEVDGLRAMVRLQADGAIITIQLDRPGDVLSLGFNPRRSGKATSVRETASGMVEVLAHAAELWALASA